MIYFVRSRENVQQIKPFSVHSNKIKSMYEDFTNKWLISWIFGYSFHIVLIKFNNVSRRVISWKNKLITSKWILCLWGFHEKLIDTREFYQRHTFKRPSKWNPWSMRGGGCIFQERHFYCIFWRISPISCRWCQCNEKMNEIQIKLIKNVRFWLLIKYLEFAKMRS